MADPRPLAGQVGVVTGAAKGLGLGITRRLADDGLHVVMVDVDGPALAASVDALLADGLSVEGSLTDVTSEEQVSAMAGDALERHGQVHVLVNNAGIFPFVPFEDLTLEFVKRMFAVNVESAILCSLALVPQMKRHGYGRIVNFASGVVQNGVGGPAYVATKAANMGLTRGMSGELAPFGVTVNSIAPGLIETPGAGGLGAREDELFDVIVAAQDVKRRGQPEDISEAVAYIVSPRSGFLTGQMLLVDGGDRYH